VRGGLHRTAAVVTIVATLFHFVHLAIKKRESLHYSCAASDH
jgi:hypothetical protein